MKTKGSGFATLLFVFATVLIAPVSVSAATILEQSTYDTEGEGGNYSLYQQVIGTGLSGQLASATFYLRPASINGGFNDDLVWLLECDRIQMDIGCNSVFSESHKLVEGGAPSFETFNFFPAVTFNPAKYYSIQVASPGGWPYGGFPPYQTHIFGSASSTFNGQPCINCLNLSSIFFRLDDTYALEDRIAEQSAITSTVSQLGFSGYPTQSFTPVQSGMIKSLAVAAPVACGVMVSDGQFATARYDSAQSIPGGSRFTGGAFPVTAGQIYYITFLCDEAFDMFSGTTADVYPGGEAGQGNMPGAGDIHFASNASVGNALLDWAFTVCTGTNCTLTPSTPPPTYCTPGDDPDCNSSVLFLPGLEASRLYRPARPDETGITAKRLWEPDGDVDALYLTMTPEGGSVRPDIFAKVDDVLDEAYVLEAGPNVYKSFIGDMNDLKTAGKIAGWKAAPYDWRLSLDDILTHGAQEGDRISYLVATDTPYIEQELRRLAADSRTGKVTIIAHSNGGLVAKALMQKLGASTTAALIDKVIFVASPQVGTPQAVGAVLHGYDQGLPKDWLPFLLTPETAREIAKDMPGVYGLLPSFDYFTYVDDPVIDFDNSALLAPWRAKYGDKIHSAELLGMFMADASRPGLPVAEAIKGPLVANSQLLSEAGAMHQARIDQWTPPAGVRVIEIAGWGEDTLKTIHYYQGVAGACTSYRPDHTCAQITSTPALDYKPILTVDGDGTVVAPSALWTTGSERYWVDLGSHNEWWINGNIPRKHADVLEVDSLRTLIRHVVTNTASTGALPDFIITSVVRDENPEKYLSFTLHSPLSLDLYDHLGNHTGYSTTTGRVETNIPGSRFKVFGGVTYATAPASTTVQVIMRGLASGSFTLDVEETHGDTVTASTTFAGIPSSPATIATITVPQNTSIASSTGLFVDENGDGDPDMHLSPQAGGVATPDIVAPEAILSFSTTTDDVLVSGSDEGAVTVDPASGLSTATLVYTLTDQSDNTTTLTFQRIKEKESKNERHGHVKAKLLSIRYATLSTSTEHVLSKNEIQYEWERDKAGVLKELKQEVTVQKDFTLRAKYDAKKNETKIYFVDKDSKEKLKEVRAGLVLVRIVTKSGGLEVEY